MKKKMKLSVFTGSLIAGFLGYWFWYFVELLIFHFELIPSFQLDMRFCVVIGLVFVTFYQMMRIDDDNDIPYSAIFILAMLLVNTTVKELLTPIAALCIEMWLVGATLSTLRILVIGGVKITKFIVKRRRG